MRRRTFSREQIAELLKNRNVAKCGEKAITYAKDFKIRAIKQYDEEGLTPTEIFKRAGFDLRIMGTETPKNCIRHWIQVFRARGSDGLLVDQRGRVGSGPKVKGSDADKIKWLEAKVAYLNAENAFLAKLRAARAE